jgi:hypothetical protein
MQKKVQENNGRRLKPFKLNKETIHLLESSDLSHVIGGLSRSLCGFTNECCNYN